MASELTKQRIESSRIRIAKSINTLNLLNKNWIGYLRQTRNGIPILCFR